jgi:hypothetical protein
MSPAGIPLERIARLVARSEVGASEMSAVTSGEKAVLPPRGCILREKLIAALEQTLGSSRG